MPNPESNSHSAASASAKKGHPAASRTKRAIDVMAALTGLLLTAPVTAPAAAAIWLTMGKPVLFRQRRPGMHGIPFTVIKFRTMNLDPHNDSTAAADAARITPVGRLLRRTSIDEIPQLLNVLRGEMSVVGPRPLLLEYLDQYTPQQRRRHDVKPGITGLAQVTGRQNLAFSSRISLDLEYIDTWTIALDFRVLARTIHQVFRSGDINPDTSRGPINDLNGNIREEDS